MHSLFRKIALLVMLLVLPCAHPESVKTLPAPTGYIDDYANVLSVPAHDELEAICLRIHDQTRAQIFLVTVHNLGGESRDDFANDLFHVWKIGEKKTDRGVLILLAIGEHQRRIEVGYGLEGILPDAKVGDIGREMVPSLKAANYDEAARIAVNEVAEIIAEDAHITLAPPPAPTPAVIVAPAPNDDSSGIIFLIIVVFVVLFFLFLLYERKRNSTTNYPDDYTPEPTPYAPAPVVQTLFTTPSEASQSDSGWGGFLSGGGSSDSGGGAFSGGDGGDSGGGGAGGDW
jgi:uncharacterized protein